MRYFDRRGGSHVLFALALLFAACAGDGGGGSTTAQTSTFQRIQTQVFDVSCATQSCHSSAVRSGGLVLEAGHAHAYLVGQTPDNPAAAEHGLMRVMPGDPSRSFLMSKLTSSLAAGEGSAMPWNGPSLDNDTIEVIRAWIEAGAPSEGMVEGDDGRALGGAADDESEVTLPEPVHGVQLRTTSPPIPAGTEETGCHYFKLPSEVDLEVNRIQIAVSGGSHHIHLYRAHDASVDLPDGYEVCNMALDFDQFELVVATQNPRTDWELPPGVAFHLRAGEQLVMQTHFVNVGALSTSGEGRVYMNLNAADPGSITAYAGSLFGQDRDVLVPAHSNIRAAAECVFPHPIRLIAQTGHYHFRGKEFRTFFWNDGVRGDEIYHHEGYDDPGFLVYPPGGEPSFAAGEGLQWECYWENPEARDFEFGPFTDTNEHCNLFAFYYPTQRPDEFTTCVKRDGVSTTTVRHPE